MGLPKKNAAFVFYVSVTDQTNRPNFKSGPTIAAGDFQVSTDGGTYVNLATLPTVTPAASVSVKISLSAAEMNGDQVTVKCIDAAGDEWDDLLVTINTTINDLDDIEAQTDDIGAAGAGLTAVPWNAAWDAEVQSEVNDALVAIGLDHLLNVAVAGGDVVDDSVFAKLVSKSATADWDDFVNTTDALQAIKDALLTAANVNSEVSDVLKTDTISEQAQGAPTATPTFEQAVMYLYMALRNKIDITATLKEFHNDAGTVIWKKTLSDDGTTYSEAEGATGP